jgi:hypothetical protein
MDISLAIGLCITTGSFGYLMGYVIGHHTGYHAAAKLAMKGLDEILVTLKGTKS